MKAATETQRHRDRKTGRQREKAALRRSVSLSLCRSVSLSLCRSVSVAVALWLCGGLRNRVRVDNFCRMKITLFLTLTVCFLFSPVYAQPKAKNAVAPANANPFQEADNLFTFG